MHGLWSAGQWWMWLMMLLFWLVPVLLLGALFWLLYAGAGARARSSEGNAGESLRALAVLKERYARGEISREEFQQMKEDIT